MVKIGKFSNQSENFIELRANYFLMTNKKSNKRKVEMYTFECCLDAPNQSHPI